MATKVFPTVADIGGDGKTIRESLLAGLIDPFGAWKISGFTVSTQTGRNVTLAPGKAMVAGRIVTTDANAVFQIPYSTTQYIHLRLAVDGSGNVTAADMVADASVAPVNAGYVYLPLAVATATTTEMATAYPLVSWPKGTHFDLGGVELGADLTINVANTAVFYSHANLQLPDGIYTAFPCRVWVMGAMSVDAGAGVTPTVSTAVINAGNSGVRYVRSGGSITQAGSLSMPFPVAGYFDLAAGAKVMPALAISSSITGNYYLQAFDTHLGAYMTRRG